MSGTALEAERRHLEELLEAIQRCVFFWTPFRMLTRVESGKHCGVRVF